MQDESVPQTSKALEADLAIHQRIIVVLNESKDQLIDACQRSDLQTAGVKSDLQAALVCHFMFVQDDLRPLVKLLVTNEYLDEMNRWARGEFEDWEDQEDKAGVVIHAVSRLSFRQVSKQNIDLDDDASIKEEASEKSD